MLTIRGIKTDDQIRRTTDEIRDAGAAPADETPLEAKLRAEISMLKAKLRPFADLARFYEDAPSKPDSWLVTARLGDCRAARDAVAPRKV